MTKPSGTDTPTNGANVNTAGSARKRLGDSGELLAARWLEARGYRVIARNWRCLYGEIDLIVESTSPTPGLPYDEVIFVEVKTRRGDALGAPEEAVTALKRRRLIASAQTYLAEQCAEQRPYRIDVVAIALASTGSVSQVRHYPRCVEGQE